MKPDFELAFERSDNVVVAGDRSIANNEKSFFSVDSTGGLMIVDYNQRGQACPQRYHFHIVLLVLGLFCVNKSFLANCYFSGQWFLSHFLPNTR